MTPEQRAQLQGLSEQLLGGHGPALADGPARPEPAAAVPADGLGPPLRLRGPGPARLRRGRRDDAASSATSTSSRTCCAAPPAPARWPRSTSTGPASCSATTPPARLERMAELAKMLEEAGLIENKEGRFELTPQGHPPASGRTPSATCSRKLAKRQDGPARARPHRRRPRARLRHQALRVRRPVQPRHRAHHPQRHPPHGRRHAGAAARPTTSRSSAPSTSSESSTVLMLDLSLSMPMRDNFLAAKKVAMALHSLISIAVPARLPRHRRLQRGGPRAQGRAAARGVVGLRLRHQHAARASMLSRQLLARQTRHEADHHDHRRRADRPHRADGAGVLQLPAGAGDGRRHAARGRPLHPRRHPHQHLHARRHAATCRRSSRSSPR